MIKEEECYQLKTLDEMCKEYPDLIGNYIGEIERKGCKGKIYPASRKMLGMKISFVACWPWWAIKGQFQTQEPMKPWF